MRDGRIEDRFVQQDADGLEPASTTIHPQTGGAFPVTVDGFVHLSDFGEREPPLSRGSRCFRRTCVDPPSSFSFRRSEPHPVVTRGHAVLPTEIDLLVVGQTPIVPDMQRSPRS